MKNDTTTSAAEKKRARTIFGAGSESVEKRIGGHGSKANPRDLKI